MAKRYSDLSLKEIVCLCAADPRNVDAWEEFVSRVDRPIGLTIKRTAEVRVKPCRSLIEDLRQETYVKLLKDGCRPLRDCTNSHEDQEILGYIKKAARNATLDYLRLLPPISTIEIDPETEQGTDRSQKSSEYRILLEEIDKHVKHCLIGPDKERDRAIFRLYYRYGMSTEEIARLPTIGLTAKGVGAVIERLKHCLRERILRSRVDSDGDEG